MNRRRMNRRRMLGTALSSAVLTAVLTGEAKGEHGAFKASSHASERLRQSLAGAAGKEVVMVEVTYPSGKGSQPHRHPGPIFGYVLEGAVVMRLDDGPEVTYREGEVFYEAPGQLHGVSRNASRRKRARILAFMVADAGAPVVIPPGE